MKNIVIKSTKSLLKYLLTAAVILTSASGCSDDILDELPRSFLSPENAFTNRQGFQAAIGDLHRLSRGLRTADLIGANIEADKAITVIYNSGTDLGWYWDKKLFYANYDLVNSEDIFARNYWRLLYNIIQGSNTILSRLPEAPVNAEVKTEAEAQARFFRAYAYRFLTHLWGDVPKLTAEIQGKKLDFVRAPQSEILALMVEDLEFASNNLVVANPGNGQLSKAAADHLLAETYVAVGKYDEAIAAASRVIGDPQYTLMKTRFGSYTSLPGDVFWDMFRLGNQNRSSGNREAIWVLQVEFNVPGGDAEYRIERAWGPLYERLRDSQGKQAIVQDEFSGRPVGFIKPSPFMDTLVWNGDFKGDIRNSSYNMQREFYVTNPASVDFGKVIKPTTSNLDREHFVYLKKAAHPEGHPQGFDSSGRIYSDIYAMRLAETYLLRAEAYLKKGDKSMAAADINTVRSRAKAIPVEPAAVDLNYILDERARELMGEEPRRLTLARTGTLYDRVKKFNPVAGPTIQPFHRLLPVPQSEIDANTEAILTQNEGY